MVARVGDEVLDFVVGPIEATVVWLSIWASLEGGIVATRVVFLFDCLGV